MPARTRPGGRRGNYLMLGALTMPVLMGFGALAIDLAWLRMAQVQAQDLSDAASQAALMTYRRTLDLDDARDAADQVIARNTIAGGPAELVDLDFGRWDEDARTFTPTDVNPNAVRAQAGRRDTAGVPYLLARIWGFDRADVVGTSTSATRSLQVILAIDITNSWTYDNFESARIASTLFMDSLTGAYGPNDRVGMVHFTGAYGVVYTPTRLVSVEAADGFARGKWNTMHMASKSGRPRPDCTPLSACTTNQKNFRCDQHTLLNVWSAGTHTGDGGIAHAEGGCFPGMWREYRDEPGTDHTAGLVKARDMFALMPDDGAYRALIMLTDGFPNGTRDDLTLTPPLDWGATRATDPTFVPAAHDYYTAPVPHTTAQIMDESVDLASDLYFDHDVNTWVVSFVAPDPGFMTDMTEFGDGYFDRAATAPEIIDIFADIAESLPIAIVE